MEETTLMVINNQKLALITSINLYLGIYPDAYVGASFWRSEVMEVKEKITNIKMKPVCSWHPCVSGHSVGFLLLTKQDIQALHSALIISLGKYPWAYHGADFFKEESEKVLARLPVPNYF